MQSTIEAAGIRSHLQRCFRRPPRPPWVRVRPTCERRGRGKQQEVSETAALQLDGQEASSEDVSGRKPCLGHPGPQGSCLYRCRQVSVPRPWWSHEVTRGDTGPFTARNRAFNIVRRPCRSYHFGPECRMDELKDVPPSFSLFIVLFRVSPLSRSPSRDGT